MGAVVGAFQAFGRQVGVDLGGGQVRVAEQFLHAAQVGARIQQVGGIAVAQLVRRHGGSSPAMARYFFSRSCRIAAERA